VFAELATIVHDPTAHHPATPTQLKSWDEQRQRDITQQIRDAERRKGEDRAADIDSAAAQKKRAEREARRAQAAKDDDDAGVEGAAPSSHSPSSSQPPANAAVYTVAVPTTSDALAWYSPDAHTYETLDAAREAGVWTYPATEEERARCEVFRDLWQKGYYLGGGGKFGGDWLVYPGACFLFFFRV
jgi:tRNA-splicing endonuclease subunit Sen34